MRFDDIVHEATLRRLVGRREFRRIFFEYLFLRRGLVLRLGKRVLEDDVHGAFRAHDRDFRRRPGQHDVRPEGLGTHSDIGPTVGLPGDQRDLGYRRLAVGIQNLGAMADDAAIFLGSPRKETGHIDQGQQGNIEGVTGPDEASGLIAGVDIETTGHDLRLVGDDTDRFTIDPGITGDQIGGEIRLILHELAIIDDGEDHIVDIIGFVGVFRNQGIERTDLSVHIIGAFHRRRLPQVVRRQIAEELPDPLDTDLIGFGDEMGIATDLVMGHGAPEVLRRHLLPGYRLDDLGPGDEHLRGLVDHENEIGQRG